VARLAIRRFSSSATWFGSALPTANSRRALLGRHIAGIIMGALQARCCAVPQQVAPAGALPAYRCCWAEPASQTSQPTHPFHFCFLCTLEGNPSPARTCGGAHSVYAVSPPHTRVTRELYPSERPPLSPAGRAIMGVASAPGRARSGARVLPRAEQAQERRPARGVRVTNLCARAECRPAPAAADAGDQQAAGRQAGSVHQRAPASAPASQRQRPPAPASPPAPALPPRACPWPPSRAPAPSLLPG
jgi:hypothetical protein